MNQAPASAFAFARTLSFMPTSMRETMLSIAAPSKSQRQKTTIKWQV